MNEQEDLYAQYEDAFFALLMNEVAEAEGQELLKKNEQLLADPNAAVPEAVSKRCLRTIEKSCRKARFQRNKQTMLRNLNRVALWILVPLLLFVGVFAASETVRVKTLNYLIEEFDVGTTFYFQHHPNTESSQEFLITRFSEAVQKYIPNEYSLTFKSSDEISCDLYYINDSGEELTVSEYFLENIDATVILDTENANVQDIIINGQKVTAIYKENFYQIAWLNNDSQTMCTLSGKDNIKDVIVNLAEKLISAS